MAGLWGNKDWEGKNLGLSLVSAYPSSFIIIIILNNNEDSVVIFRGKEREGRRYIYFLILFLARVKKSYNFPTFFKAHTLSHTWKHAVRVRKKKTFQPRTGGMRKKILAWTSLSQLKPLNRSDTKHQRAVSPSLFHLCSQYPAYFNSLGSTGQALDEGRCRRCSDVMMAT